jgi:hypothetical protein
MATDIEDARKLHALARERNLQIASAPIRRSARLLLDGFEQSAAGNGRGAAEQAGR